MGHLIVLILPPFVSPALKTWSRTTPRSSPRFQLAFDASVITHRALSKLSWLAIVALHVTVALTLTGGLPETTKQRIEAPVAIYN